MKKAMRGDFITMLEIFKCKIAYRKGHKKKSVGAKLNKLLNDEDDEEADNYSGQLTLVTVQESNPRLDLFICGGGKTLQKNKDGINILPKYNPFR